ncbi:MAG: Xaa-Pro peptidase family protein [Nevskiaceae bacterium]|nr:Xaa-Pro peptidase family protein [Nevskiaceae bacterium]
MKQSNDDGLNASEIEWRCQRIRKALAANDLEALLIFSPAWRRENVRYLSDAALEASAAFAYLPSSGAVTAFACSNEDELSLRKSGFVSDIRLIDFPDVVHIADCIGADLRSGRIGLAGLEFLPQRIMAQLQALLPHIEFQRASALMDSVRLVKSDLEISRLRAGGVICDKSWQAFLDACRPGAREFEIIAGVEARLRGEGAEDNFMIIASGGTEVMGMTPPSDRRLKVGDLVRTELTPQTRGYWTQICRTAVIGEPSARQKESFALFEEAVAAGIAVIKPGVTAHDVAKAENDVFRRHGYGEYCTSEYTRVRGHCLGLHLDEYPILEDESTVLEKNSVLIVHPNTYTPLAGYFVLGDPVVVTERGAERLLSTPRQLSVVPV